MASKNFDLPCQSDYRLQPFGHFIPQSPWDTYRCSNGIDLEQVGKTLVARTGNV